MPELPEVETTLRGIAPYALGQGIERVLIREGRLRWPVPRDLPEILQGQRIETLTRRGKYILFGVGEGTVILHLGMSGSLRVVDPASAPRKHDHIDVILTSGLSLRYHDPRRFGCLLYTRDDPAQHPLIARLGPEPLGEPFTGQYLHQRAQGRSTAVKTFIMDSHVVVGVGNIYASESLFSAGIAPACAAGRISLLRYERLARTIRAVLTASIEQGGTTLRDFVNEAGQPGYFQQTLGVYGRAGEPCRVCASEIQMSRLGQRATYWCPSCQR